jgi:ankyrin repeat protein
MQCVQNRTNLIQACEYGHKAVIDLLLSRGAAVNDVNFGSDGNTALIIIIRRGYDNEIVDWLLKRGASVNKKNKFGLTALHWAAMINNTVVINRLVSCGADISVKDNEGRTPLWYAACNVHIDAIRLLLAYGAHPHCKW